MTSQLVMNIRLYFRNRMALFYGYLFPTVFLIAFWVLYRYDRVPLIRHVGEMLTITILAGACFGLPTTLVGERERGVWRRFKLAPISTGSLVVSTLVARYAILITAGLWQLVLAMSLGMPMPQHPFELWVAFTVASFAFLGLGLVIAMLADNVPAVQALGQAIFLPMLIVGGVAVPLTALPEWAQHVSAFLPGRYSVEAIQATAGSDGLSGVKFALLALTTIGLAACTAGARLFRWDAQQRFMARTGKGWLAVALIAWGAIGIAAEYQGYVRVFTGTEVIQRTGTSSAPSTQGAGSAESATSAGTVGSVGSGESAASAGREGRAASAESAGAPAVTGPAASATVTPPSSAVTSTAAPSALPAPSTQAPSALPAPPAPSAPSSGDKPGPSSWREVTLTMIDEEIVFTPRIPPDSGVVTPIAGDNDPVDDAAAFEVGQLRDALRTWPPGLIPDLLQRTRNVLYVAAVVDVFQWATESLVPHAVFDKLQEEIPRDDLLKILYWIANYYDEGTDNAIDEMQPLGIRNGPSDIQEVRGRAALYAVKLIGRITGKRPGR